MQPGSMGRYVTGAFLLLAAAAGLWFNRQQPNTLNANIPAVSGSSKPLQVATCKVLVIYDGDTFGCDTNGNNHVDGKPEHVRMLGIDTPEMGYSRKSKTHRDAPFALESKQWLSDHALGKSVRLVYDVRTTDKYQRQLAHVYLGDQTVSLNQQLLQQGYARLMFIAPNQAMLQAYTQALQGAQQANRGIWQ